MVSSATKRLSWIPEMGPVAPFRKPAGVSASVNTIKGAMNIPHSLTDCAARYSASLCSSNLWPSGCAPAPTRTSPSRPWYAPALLSSIDIEVAHSTGQNSPGHPEDCRCLSRRSRLLVLLPDSIRPPSSHLGKGRLPIETDFHRQADGGRVAIAVGRLQCRKQGDLLDRSSAVVGGGPDLMAATVHAPV